MTIQSRTSFDVDKFNKMVGEYAEQALSGRHWDHIGLGLPISE